MPVSTVGESPAPSTRNLTDLRPTPKRNRRAEADRHRMTATPLHRRIVDKMRAAGLEPEAWQVESVAASLIANGEQPTDADLMRELMRAPWTRKPGRRHWRLGEGGGWATTSSGGGRDA